MVTHHRLGIACPKSGPKSGSRERCSVWKTDPGVGPSCSSLGLLSDPECCLVSVSLHICKAHYSKESGYVD